MIRQCSWCRKKYGEKCKNCGNDSPVAVGFTGEGTGFIGGEATIWNCHQCGRTWWEGSDGITHGMCESCIAESRVEKVV